MRIDLSTLIITPTDDPAIFTISGRATEDDVTITNDRKTWYPFEIKWNKNRKASEFSAAVGAVIDEQKPKPELSDLKAALISANKKALVDMTGEEPAGETP